MQKSVKRALGALIAALVTAVLLLEPTITLAAQTIHVKQSLRNGYPAAQVMPSACDPTQWHFIINQIDTEAHVPSSITIVLQNVSTNVKVTKTVPLSQTSPPGSGGNTYVGHYSLTSYLTGYALYDGYTSIYDGWDGNFVLSCPGPATPPPPGGTSGSPCLTGGDSMIQANFNGTAIPVTDYIWFNGVLKVPSGMPATGAWINVTNQHITFTAGSTNYNLPVPDASIGFFPHATSAMTNFGTTVLNPPSNGWGTTVPVSQSSANTFMSGVAFAVPAGGLPGGISGVKWSANFSSPTPGVQNMVVNWQWAAAVYSQLGSDFSSATAYYNSLGVKPVDSNTLSPYQNSDHAGTPENFKSYVVGGATGGGGSNYTGSYSGTASVVPCVPPNNGPPPPPTPELDSFVLFGVGALGLGGYLFVQRRKRRGRAAA